MKIGNKSEQELLDKLGFTEWNEMQSKALEGITQNKHAVIISPTGSGKTIAFLLPLLQLCQPGSQSLQLLIMAPSRELALQIETVIREMGAGFKVHALYGGRSGQKDKMDLATTPDIIVGTPGRVVDHFRRENLSTEFLRFVVLDEYDKLLEFGFEGEMGELMEPLDSLEKLVLTSATSTTNYPRFLKDFNPQILDFTGAKESQLELICASNSELSKLELLEASLIPFNAFQGIVFCNLKDTLHDVATYFDHRKIDYAVFHGGMEQRDRENSLIQFRNQTHRILLATDLAARGLDIPELGFIVHFELPQKEAEFIHRNGRTARMNAAGKAIVLKAGKKPWAEYLPQMDEIHPGIDGKVEKGANLTLMITGGRKDKISKGDIVGAILKQTDAKPYQVGSIELKSDCAFVGVAREIAPKVVEKINNVRLKKKKVRVSILK